MELCPGAWNKLTAIMGAAVKKRQTHKVTVKGKAKCPDCGKEFDAEFQIDQEVAGAAVNLNVTPLKGLSSLCMWKQ